MSDFKVKATELEKIMIKILVKVFRGKLLFSFMIFFFPHRELLNALVTWTTCNIPRQSLASF